MKIFFFLIIISQFISLYKVNAEKDQLDSGGGDSLKWELIKMNDNNNNIIWESYENEKNNFLKINSEEEVLEPKNNNLTIEKKRQNEIMRQQLFRPLEEKDQQISLGGLTVNNALLPRVGQSQISLNLDFDNNSFGFYGYSLSNRFQLELANIGYFQDISSKSNNHANENLRTSYLHKKELNFRLGGKFLIFSPQKNDRIWSSIRTSVGRYKNANNSYIYSEFINTFRLNKKIAFNINPKYIYSGLESFAALGLSSYVNLTKSLQFIPEVNTLLKNNSESNSTFALRYSYSTNKSLDIYYTNALGNQDLGQILRAKDNKFGIRLNFLY